MAADSDSAGRALLQRRVEYLTLLEAAATAANNHELLEDAAQIVLDQVCAFTRWPVGHLYLTAGAGGDLLVSSRVWHIDTPDRFEKFRQETEAAPLAKAAGMPGHILESGRPVWVSDVGADPNFARRASAQQAGLAAAFAFPVPSGGEVAAVMEFFSDEPAGPDDELLTTMTGIGAQLGRVVDRQRATDQLRGKLAERALRDELTGLPNRALLLDRIEHALTRAATAQCLIAVCSLDIDMFKTVNDRLGRERGDELLRAVAGRLKGLSRPGDTLARIGGDEFALLWEDLAGRDEAVELIKRVTVLFEDPFDVAGEAVVLSTSGGAAIAEATDGGDEQHAEMLLREANAATYRAKKAGRNRFEIFDEAMLAAVARRRGSERDLRRAISAGELRVHYQPIVALATGGLAGVEALVRWQHPTRGLVPPAEFIPLAEDAGLIGELGGWVLTEACRQAATWEAARRGEFTLSVNVSPNQFQADDWVDQVARALGDAGLDPPRLVVEITESVLARDTQTVAWHLGQLRDLGIRVAIDDFGTGYSSLSYLRQLPVDILKIDKSFIDGVTQGPHESALARAVVKLTKTLGLTAIAEGIEREEQLIRLRRLGCQYGQGYFLGRPEPAERIDELLRGRTTNAAL